MKYLKSAVEPVEVEAIQFLGFQNNEPMFSENPEWFKLIIDDMTDIEFYNNQPELLRIVIPKDMRMNICEDELYVGKGNYIIISQDHKINICEQDIFEKIYKKSKTNSKENKKMNTTIKFAKVKPNAIIPTKRNEDAGFDIYACFEEESITIPPHTTVMIPTGLACACSEEYCLVLKERGSTGSKGIAQRCGIIDSGYRDEIFVPLTNTTDKPVIVSKDEKTEYTNAIVYPYKKAVCQALVIPVPKVTVQEVTYEDLKSIKSERMNGKLGSSGK